MLQQSSHPTTAAEVRMVQLKEINSWVLPLFQRSLRINDKVKALGREIAENGGIVDGGPFTLGTIIGRPSVVYLCDGQHRRESCRLSGLTEWLVEIRHRSFNTYEEMAREFTQANTRLVTMSPDDHLRAMEEFKPLLRKIRTECPYVGYNHTRAGGKSSVVRMSQLIRAWYHSSHDTPPANSAGGSATDLGENLAAEEADGLIEFMKIARGAWGDEEQNYPLWKSGNLVLSMWLWRRLVKEHVFTNSRSARPITPEDFRTCLIALSVNTDYMDKIKLSTLRGHRERSTVYRGMKEVFSKALTPEGGKKFRLPDPEWAQ